MNPLFVKPSNFFLQELNMFKLPKSVENELQNFYIRLCFLMQKFYD
jgi:hypothetical protein